MSTFCGLMEEIPGVSVDYFKETNFPMSSAFFLSHCHTDHMEGIDQYNYKFFEHLCNKNQYLYCSEISKVILIHINKLTHKPEFQDRIQTIKGFSPVMIQLTDQQGNEEYVNVTCIPAGHCPGSVMFLFEKDDKTVLYTGDFRINVDDFAKLKPLHDIVNGKLIPKTFDNIYLDTTFLSSDYEYFPSRQRAFDEMLPIVQEWIKVKGNVIVLECSANYGPENLFIELSRALKLRIHVKAVPFISYTFIPELANCITNDSYSTPLHACMRKQKKDSESVITCRSDVKKSSVLTVIPSTWRWKGENLRERISELDPVNRRFYVCYAVHPSKSELEAFIRYFKPKKLYPNVCPRMVNIDFYKHQLNDAFKFTTNDTKVSNVSYDIDFSEREFAKKAKVKPLNFSDSDDNDDD